MAIYSWSKIGLNGMKDTVKEEIKIAMEALDGSTFYRNINQKQYIGYKKRERERKRKSTTVLHKFKTKWPFTVQAIKEF